MIERDVLWKITTRCLIGVAVSAVAAAAAMTLSGVAAILMMSGLAAAAPSSTDKIEPFTFRMRVPPAIDW